MQFRDEGFSLGRLNQAVDAARECGFAAVAANDHFVFSTPWLDGPTALASVIGRSGEMALATTVSLAVLRGPVPLGKALTALQILSEGRLVAAVGPGSSQRDYEAVGIPFEERWKRLDDAIAQLRGLVDTPLWIGSWGSDAGLRRVARAGDGWLASAYNTDPDRFAETRERLGRELEQRGRNAAGFPNALATMWTWVTEDRAERDRVLEDLLAPILKRDPDELRDRLCIGPAEHCAARLSEYAAAGCGRVYLWPLGDEPRQIELAATAVRPAVKA